MSVKLCARSSRAFSLHDSAESRVAVGITISNHERNRRTDVLFHRLHLLLHSTQHSGLEATIVFHQPDFLSFIQFRARSARANNLRGLRDCFVISDIRSGAR